MLPRVCTWCSFGFFFSLLAGTEQEEGGVASLLCVPICKPCAVVPLCVSVALITRCSLSRRMIFFKGVSFFTFGVALSFRRRMSIS